MRAMICRLVGRHWFKRTKLGDGIDVWGACRLCRLSRLQYLIEGDDYMACGVDR